MKTEEKITVGYFEPCCSAWDPCSLQGRLIEERCGEQVLARYEYGYLDKVISVTRGQEVIRFHYNARGMLVGKERNGQMIDTLGWDGIGLLAKGDTVYANEAHVSGGVPLLSVNEKQTDFYDHDYLGTTTAHYSAEGETRSSLHSSLGQGADNSESRFTGKPYDEDLAAHVFPYRNYRSDMGRWSSADPAGFPDGPNQHYYAPVPTLGLDPLGLEIQFVEFNETVTNGGMSMFDYFVHHGVKNTFRSKEGDIRDVHNVELNAKSLVYDSDAPNSEIKLISNTTATIRIGWNENDKSLYLDDINSGGMSSSDGKLHSGMRIEYEVRDNGKEIKVDVITRMADNGTNLTGVGIGLKGAKIGGSFNLDWEMKRGEWAEFRATMIFKEL